MKPLASALITVTCWNSKSGSRQSRSNNTIFPLSGPEASTQVPNIASLAFLGLCFLAMATALRVIFLDWGLPHIYHGDEPFAISIIHRMIAESDLNPRAFYYPSFSTTPTCPGNIW